MRVLCENSSLEVAALEKEAEVLRQRLAVELEEKQKLQARIKELEPFVAKCDALQAEADLTPRRKNLHFY